jgi:hypothetical protein
MFIPTTKPTNVALLLSHLSHVAYTNWRQSEMKKHAMKEGSSAQQVLAQHYNTGYPMHQQPQPMQMGQMQPQPMQMGQMQPQPMQMGQMQPQPMQMGQMQPQPMQMGQMQPQPMQMGQMQPQPMQMGQMQPQPMQMGQMQPQPMQMGQMGGGMGLPPPPFGAPPPAYEGGKVDTIDAVAKPAY